MVGVELDRLYCDEHKAVDFLTSAGFAFGTHSFFSVAAATFHMQLEVVSADNQEVQAGCAAHHSALL